MNGVCEWAYANCVVWSSGGACTTCAYGYRLLNGYCFSCFNPSAGYINCPVDCVTNPSTATGSYRRDGDLYTASYNPNAEPGITYGANLLISIVSLLICFIMFI